MKLNKIARSLRWTSNGILQFQSLWEKLESANEIFFSSVLFSEIKVFHYWLFTFVYFNSCFLYIKVSIYSKCKQKERENKQDEIEPYCFKYNTKHLISYLI